MNDAIPERPEDPILMITRVVAAPRRMLWAAFTEAPRLCEWYGSDELPTARCTVDLRPGGRWSHTLAAPDGTEFEITNTYLDIVDGILLQWTNASPSHASARPGDITQTVAFTDHGAGSQWTLVARYTNAAERDRSVAAGFRDMVLESASRLDAYLATQPVNREATHA